MNWSDRKEPRVRGLDWPTYRKARAMGMLEAVARPAAPLGERGQGRKRWSGKDQKGVGRGHNLP